MTKGQHLITLLLIGILTMAGAIIGSKMVVARSSKDQTAKTIDVSNAQKWEYRVVDINNGNPEKAQAIANALGEQGFEMVNFSDSRFAYQFVFKRLKPQ